MIQLRDIHLADGSTFPFISYLERCDYAEFGAFDHFGANNFAFLTGTSETITVPSGSVRVVRLDTRQRSQRIASQPVNIKVSGVGDFSKCLIIDKADYAYANMPTLFAPQLAWSCETGTYIANVSHVISISASDKVRTSKVIPRNALHVKNED